MSGLQRYSKDTRPPSALYGVRRAPTRSCAWRFDMATKQYRKLGCLQVNPTGGCAFEVQAETDDEVMRLTGEHARHAHNMTAIPPETASKLRSMILAVNVN